MVVKYTGWLNKPTRDRFMLLRDYDKSSEVEKEIIENTLGYQSSLLVLNLLEIKYQVLISLPFIGNIIRNINDPKQALSETEDKND